MFVPIIHAMECSCKRRPMPGVMHIIHNAAAEVLTLSAY